MTCVQAGRSRAAEMPIALIDGIKTNYEVIGDGPPLLMYAPAGFDATLDKWKTQGVYTRIKLLDHLPKKYSCIVFDRRECGQSGAASSASPGGTTWRRARDCWSTSASSARILWAA